MSSSSEGTTLAVVSFGPAPSDDPLAVAVLSLNDASWTPWFSVRAEWGAGYILPDGSILLQVGETSDTAMLYRLRAPGQAERLGTIRRASRESLSPGI